MRTALESHESGSTSVVVPPGAHVHVPSRSTPANRKILHARRRIVDSTSTATSPESAQSAAIEVDSMDSSVPDLQPALPDESDIVYPMDSEVHVCDEESTCSKCSTAVP